MISAIRLHLLTPLAYLAIAIPISAFAQAECAGRDALRPHVGQYVLSTVWEALPKIKNWTIVQMQSSKALGGETIPAFAITGETEVLALNTWHEGGTACLSIRDGGIWAQSVNGPTRWQGPYTKLTVNSDIALEQLLFKRLFSGQCYMSASKERWCFSRDGILVGKRQYRATLMSDTVEVPGYGTAVGVEGDPMFWMFVPTAHGWKVFKDTWVTDDNRVEVDPGTTKPWRVLHEVRAAK